MSAKYHERNSWDEDLGCLIVFLAIGITVAVIAITTLYIGSHFYPLKGEQQTMKTPKKPNYISESPNLVYYFDESDNSLHIIIPDVENFPSAYHRFQSSENHTPPGNRKWIASTAGDKLLIKDDETGSTTTNIALNVNCYVRKSKKK